jgi:tetratricopeptide (TPR) repeat protein
MNEVRQDRNGRRPRSRGWLAALALAISLWSGAGRAQKTDAVAGVAVGADTPLSPGYEAAIKLAVSEFDAGNFAEARVRFLEAHKLYPNARTLRALGMVEYELRHYAKAIVHLQTALASEVRPLDENTRTAALELLKRTRGYVGRVHVDVLPSIATVSVDGIPRALPSDGVLLLDVGDHQIEFKAPDYRSALRSVHCEGAAEQTLQLSLEAEARTESAPRALRKSPWLWTAVGFVVVGAATGAILAFSDNDAKTRNANPYSGSTGAVLSAR